MVYDGKYYTTKSTIGSNKYRIYYKDTGKYEKNGQEQVWIRKQLKNIQEPQQK